MIAGKLLDISFLESVFLLVGLTPSFSATFPRPSLPNGLDAASAAKNSSVDATQISAWQSAAASEEEGMDNPEMHTMSDVYAFDRLRTRDQAVVMRAAELR